jgi:lipopolysaccharide biosynthesis glycosyltransferase
MKRSDKIILYHVYGQDDLYRQVLFSILTLYHHVQGVFEGMRIVVYTDHTIPFEKLASSLPLSIELLDKETIQKYKGKHHFIHRVKICVLQDCFQKYNSNILYLDSDTYFTKSPIHLLDKINIETSIMNSDDYDLLEADELFENMDWLQIRRAIKNFKYTIEGIERQIPLTTRMWNAGVIGMSFDHLKTLEDILSLTDQIYANKHVFTAEQFAFSYFLQNKSTLISSGDVIFHYWPNFGDKNWKSIYSHHIKKFFHKHKFKSIADQASLAYHLSTQHHQLISPTTTLADRITKRVKLVWDVALKGKI